MDKIVDLDFAKRLKAEGYRKPCEFYYQDKDLPYSKSGLKRTKNDIKLNHNNYDDYVYSAPTVKEGIDYLLGKKMSYEATVRIKLGGNIMGVMSCSRKNCDNIMCDTYKSDVGYICNDCISEFKEYVQKEGIYPTTEGQITKELKIFMDIPKDSYAVGKLMTIDDYFRENTRN